MTKKLYRSTEVPVLRNGSFYARRTIRRIEICPDCRGRGKRLWIRQPCQKCKGSGYVSVPMGDK